MINPIEAIVSRSKEEIVVKLNEMTRHEMMRILTSDDHKLARSLVDATEDGEWLGYTKDEKVLRLTTILLASFRGSNQGDGS